MSWQIACSWLLSFIVISAKAAKSRLLRASISSLICLLARSGANLPCFISSDVIRLRAIPSVDGISLTVFCPFSGLTTHTMMLRF